MDLLQSLILPTSSTSHHLDHGSASESAVGTNRASGIILGSSSDADSRLRSQDFSEHQTPEPIRNLDTPCPDATMAAYPYSDIGSVHAIPLEEFQAMYSPEPQLTRIKPLETEKTLGQQAAKFNNLCQLHGIKGFFTFPEISKGLFSAHVQFGEHILEDAGPFLNKKQAKEAICSRGIEVLNGVNKPEKLKRKRSPPQKGEEPEPKVSEVDDSEAWISILMHAVDKKVIARPKERYYEADVKHLQRLGLPTSGRQYAVAMTIEGFLEIFGGEEMLFESKAMAKRNAAREVVLYLRNNGYLSAEPQENKRAQVTQQRIESAAEGRTGLVPGIVEMKGNESIFARVRELVLQLGLTPPTYKESPASPPPGANTAFNGHFISMAAHFNIVDAEREPRVAGPVGEVHHVFGKKTAKEQCARKVLEVLETVKRDRMAQVERLL